MQQYKLSSLLKFLPAAKFIEEEYKGDAELVKTKLECRTLILEFVDGREADFDKFRKRVLDTFTRMNIIKSELGSMWESLEVANWSDEIVNGIAK